MRFGLFSLALALTGCVLFGGFVLIGAWIDGRRQALRKRGLHPVTTADGQVEAREFEATQSPAREPQHGGSQHQQDHQS